MKVSKLINYLFDRYVLKWPRYYSITISDTLHVKLLNIINSAYCKLMHVRVVSWFILP